MDRKLSIGLDAARLLAAIYVVYSHLIPVITHSPTLRLSASFGQEAVIVFFLLSGYVIFANEFERAGTVGYFLRRARRIYPPLVVALATSTVVAHMNGALGAEFSAYELWGSLFGLQDISSIKPGVIVDPYLGNLPLWSLSYELAFYATFPFALTAWKRAPDITALCVGLGSCLSYVIYALAPSHWALVAAYFLLWWTGAMAAAGGRHYLLSLFWLLILCTISGAVVLIDGFDGLGYYPFLPFRHFAVGFIVIVAAKAIGGRLTRLCAPFARPLAWGASISYGVYVLHYPLLVQFGVPRGVAGVATGLAMSVVISWAIDRKLVGALKARRAVAA